MGVSFQNLFPSAITFNIRNRRAEVAMHVCLRVNNNSSNFAPCDSHLLPTGDVTVTKEPADNSR